MNYCCAAGNCSGCWHHFVRYGRIRLPSYGLPRVLPPVLNQDTGDEDDGLHVKEGSFHRSEKGWTKR